MKTSLYRMLGVEHDAGTEDIAAAYERALAQLEPALQRGDHEAINQSRILKDGYAVLRDAARRARYDASLAAADDLNDSTAMKHEAKWRRQRWTFAAVLSLVLALAIATAYFRFFGQVQETGYRYREAVAAERAKKKKPDVVQYKELIVPAAPPLREDK